MKNPRGAWRMCLAATLSLFCIVGLTINAFSVYQPYLQVQCALSNTQAANYIGFAVCLLLHLCSWLADFMTNWTFDLA